MVSLEQGCRTWVSHEAKTGSYDAPSAKP